MGAFLSYLWWGMQNPDEDDPISGLSIRDIYYVRKSWTKVSADGVSSGTELLIRYFTSHPEGRLFFRTFKDMSNEDLRNNRQFQAHALNIITTITSIIDNLHKPDLAVAMCEKIGKSHNSRKITEKPFNDLKDVLVDMFKNILKFDEETMQSWVKMVTFMYSNIFKLFDK
ncbi:globin 1 [Arctopsyche grandis]|uniref:globin 1 n=1 Tax=Arctopsyche grandis TaxID=121162 RepID=UPI00406D8175